jgi:hypothetical protein
MSQEWTPPNPLTDEWYLAACECYAAGKPNPPITEEPQTSWLRASLFKGGPLLPVLYWYDGTGALYCMIDGEAYADSDRLPNQQTVREFWPMASKRPVTAEQWEYYEQHKNWPDMPDVIYVEPELKGVAYLQAQIEPLLKQATEMIKRGAAKNQEEAVKANNLHNQLTAWFKLHNTKAGKEALKRIRNEDPRITPQVVEHYDLYHGISAQCLDWVKRCDIYVSLKEAVIEPYQKAAAARDRAAGREPAKSMPGVVGRTIPLVPVKKVKMVDFNLALAHFIENAELKDFIQHLGEKLYRETKGTIPPGFEEYTEEDSR